MTELKFYGHEDANAEAIDESYRGIKTPADLYRALRRCWCAKTCAPRMRDRWSEDNMTLGQCSITAFLAQDIFGGEVRGIALGDGNFHCYNAAGGCVFDLTSEQFDRKLEYREDDKIQLREVHFAKEEKRMRYELLKARLQETVGENDLV